MRVDLLKHNQEAYEKVQKAIKEGKKKIAISHATGTGKSYLIAKLFEDFDKDKKLVLVPSTYISEQIQVLFEKYKIQKVDVMRYQKLIKMSDEDIAAMDYDVIALDEYHHDTSKVWGNKVRTLIESHSESIIFGTSATPIRSDGVNTIDELFEGNCVSDLPLSESIAKKIVPLPKYVGALYTLDDELERLRKKVENATNTKEEKQEFYKKINAMRSQIEKSYGMPIILNKNIKNKEGKYIVFCKNKKHLAEIKDTVIGWFRTAGCKNINAYVVHSSYENKDAEYKAFCNDTSHNLKLLFSIDVLNEGSHLENISGVLLLRPTRSSIVWHQQIGRAIEANNTNIPVIIDAVNNFSTVGQGMELMREIKDAIAKEKESDTDFDDSGFEDIDTFFVLEQIVEIQEMFKEIEKGLQDDWENGLRHFDKYVREHDGDVLVSKKYIDEDGFYLGNWVGNRRKEFKGNLMPVSKVSELNKRGFIWDVHRYEFEKNVIAVSDFYKKYNKYPHSSMDDPLAKKLGRFINNEKIKLRKCAILPEWKMRIFNEYLPDFSKKTNSDKQFARFIYFLKFYITKHNSVNISEREVMEGGYKIGNKLGTLKQAYKHNKLSANQIEQLETLGIYLGSARERNFKQKMDLVKKAVEENITINKTNPKYGGIDLYNWIVQTVKRRYVEKRLLSNEIEVIEKLLGKTLDDFFSDRNKTIMVIDMWNDKKIYKFESIGETARRLNECFNVMISNSSISYHVNNGFKTPYKGRFMFYYATDEEVKKYLEENKASQL